MKGTTKFIILLLFIISVVGGKFFAFDYPISNGKRVGNLTKLSLKGKILKTWEGTVDEGSGDKLTTEFSVRSDALANELYSFEGREVVLYYEEYYLGWPRDTNYNVTSWKPQEDSTQKEILKKVSEQQPVTSSSPALGLLSRTLFCTFLGSLIKNPRLYKEVKDYIKEQNLYLYNQYEVCNQKD